MALRPETSAGYMTNLAGRLFARAIERRLAPLGLNPAHMPILLGLEAGPQPQKILAERARVRQPTMTATLNRMEKDGLVERLPNPEDGRSSLVALTPKARDKLGAVAEAGQAVNLLALKSLSREERAQYFALLEQVIANLDKDDEPIDP
ncbi:MarR family winged helix-turn-helix transcriptional regulator [Devosia faecipullorum]|uniref:MarR family winged helix-turn-helix transcriptional regulator n=1 Tax=Devosia faecipullorum TaxID=2755039 RepID=UPI00187B3899|nr:MarR family transcriptional regulator [Devosia faecipullorum]MBE7732681.1 MarR family transcriptional regulator [Devosia faecipullorum]